MPRARDYRAEQLRRNELARARGFRSRAQERKFSRYIRNQSDLERLPPLAQEQRGGALRAVSYMRADPSLDLGEAARQAGTSPEAVVWFAGEGVERRGRGWRATAGDRLYRRMVVHSDGETLVVDVRGSRKASEVAAYHATVRRFLETGDETALRRYSGRTVAGVPYEVEPSVLEEMARRHQLNIDSIYLLVV